jgi:hypothetical protein
MQYFNDKKYYKFSDVDLYAAIKNKICVSYSDDFFKKFGKKDKLIKHLQDIKGMQNQYGGYNSINQYGGYNSINHELNMIGYELVKDATGNIFKQIFISNSRGIYVNDDSSHTEHTLPSYLQIYYEIKNKTNNEIKKIILINLYYERSDTNSRLITKDFFFQKDHKYKSILNDFDSSTYMMKNVISLYDCINFLSSSITQIFDRYRKKNILKIIFLLNLLNNNNFPLLKHEIITHINSVSVPGYYADIKQLCDNIITLLGNIFTTKNDVDEIYRYINGLHLNIIGLFNA